MKKLLTMMLYQKRFKECLGWFMLGFSIHWMINLPAMSVIVIADEPVVAINSITTPQQQQRNHQRTSITNHNNKMMKRRQREMTKTGINDGNNSRNTTTTTTTSYTTNNNDDGENDAIKFVFFVGLEGTGHHLMASILQKSPMKERLLKHGLLESKNIILPKLFDKTLDPRRGDKGLWDAHCNHPYKPIDTIRIQEKLSSKLRRLNTQLLKKKKKKSDGTLIFPINTLWSTSGYGMISYPNFGGWQSGGCRFLSYPNLDLWYDVCDMAGVTCEHIMLYRDPIQILHSTVNKRGFNPNLLMSIYLYTTMIHIINSQLFSNQYSKRTIGCYGFYEPSNKSWFHSVYDLFWSTSKTKTTKSANVTTPAATTEELDDYESIINSIYRPPKPVTFYDLLTFNITATTSSISSTRILQKNEKNLELYMRLIYDMHNRTIERCNDALLLT